MKRAGISRHCIKPICRTGEVSAEPVAQLLPPAGTSWEYVKFTDARAFKQRLI